MNMPSSGLLSPGTPPVALVTFCHHFRQPNVKLLQHNKVHHLFSDTLLCQHPLPTGISELLGERAASKYSVREWNIEIVDFV